MTLLDFNTIHEPGLYQDLMREFEAHGHNVFIISPVERRKGRHAEIIHEGKTIILKLKIGNIQKTNIIEKGISTISIEPILIAGIKRYFSEVTFDLVLYSTPPITLVSAIEYVKKRDGAETYLLLKDIFPQNAVDIGIMTKNGLKGILYKHFRDKEKKLYRISDRIGCMSQANVDYVLKHNPEVNPSIVEICPNCIEVTDKSVTEDVRRAIREKYNIPFDKKVFVYGGNLGKPQSIPFIIECLRKCRDIDDAFFLIVGNGTEYGLLEAYVKNANQKNLKLMKQLSKEDYDTMIGACDVGMIFLDHRFTIPNFPSRLLSYMQAKLPVLAVTDPNTDVGKVIVDGGFGWWLPSNDVDHVKQLIESINEEQLAELGFNGFQYLCEHYSVDKAYKIINCNHDVIL